MNVKIKDFNLNTLVGDLVGNENLATLIFDCFTYNND